MRKVSYSNRILLVDIGEEWSLVVDLEVEDTMLIWKFERSGVGSCCGARFSWDESAAVKWRKHAELELEGISSWDSEWDPFIP